MAREGADLLKAPLTVFEAPAAYQAIYRQAPGTRFAADGFFAGENRPAGAMITYAVTPANPPAETADEGDDKGLPAADTTGAAEGENEKKEEATIEIIDAGGEVIRTLKGPAEPGINRAYWELSRKGIRFGAGGGSQNQDTEPAGADVLPGLYTARVYYGDHSGETTIEVKADPRIDVNPAGLEARLALYTEWEADAEVANKAAEQLRKARETVKTVNERLGEREDDATETLVDQGRQVDEALQAFEERYTGKEVQGIRRDPETVQARLFTARSYIASGMNAPDPGAHLALEQARQALGELLEDINAFFDGDWNSYRQAVEQANVSLFDDVEALSLEE
jgi:hypothetical protein